MNIGEAIITGLITFSNIILKGLFVHLEIIIESPVPIAQNRIRKAM
ncbi:hypothetical protein [Aestuariibaculum sediminum]|uniref:Uncharacterized protein n=1 Tax=Aestuariibaculum sediminum TaxID=2770637 RepID=A0A8J6PYC3_9FLAO|nr:hypothetical protein [Aestuariibaculum sediminum]MBD0830903.1 hypothetical protein [Aestuariibaculum sediminum]